MKVHDKSIILKRVTLKPMRCQMHAALKNVMRVCRWIGFFPVEGLEKENFELLKFNMNSLYGIYYVFNILGQALITILSFYYVIKNSISIQSATILLFCVTSFIGVLFLMRLSFIWPSLILKASEIEHRLKNMKISKYTAWKSKAVAYTIWISGLVEHILCIVYDLKTIILCLNKPFFSYEVYKSFIILQMPNFYNAVSFSTWNSILIEIINLQTTFIWSFFDVMISCFSIYLTAYFETLNKIINSVEEKTAEKWEEIRHNYSLLAALVKEVDMRINHCVLLTLFTDLVFICLQLYNTLSLNDTSLPVGCSEINANKVKQSFTHMLYYSFSFAFLIGRILVLCNLSANLNTVAQEPIYVLGDVPSSIYNLTIERFHRQVVYIPIAITGIFFNITRKMILSVLGTIITYELVLHQFSQGKSQGNLNGSN